MDESVRDGDVVGEEGTQGVRIEACKDQIIQDGEVEQARQIVAPASYIDCEDSLSPRHHPTLALNQRHYKPRVSPAAVNGSLERNPPEHEPQRHQDDHQHREAHEGHSRRGAEQVVEDSAVTVSECDMPEHRDDDERSFARCSWTTRGS